MVSSWWEVSSRWDRTMTLVKSLLPYGPISPLRKGPCPAPHCGDERDTVHAFGEWKGWVGELRTVGWRENTVGSGRKRGSLVESKAGAVPSAPLSCMGNTSTNSFLNTDSR